MDCKECVFNVTENGKQVGCQADRLEKLKDKNAAELSGSFYELKQFCNMYRNQDVDVETARDHVMPLFGIVVHHALDRSLEDVKTTIDSILDIDYPEQKVKVVISSPSTIEHETLVHYTNVLKQKYRAVELVLHLHNDVPMRDNECFRKLTKSTYFVKIKSGETIRQDLLKEIDRKINDDLFQLCMADAGEATIVLKSLMQQFYYNHANYDEAVNYVKQISLEQDKYEKL